MYQGQFSLIGGYKFYSCPSLGVMCASDLRMVAVRSSELLIPTHLSTLSFHSQECHNRKRTSIFSLCVQMHVLTYRFGL